MNAGAARLLRATLWLVLLGLVLMAGALAAFLIWGLPQLLGTITINGEAIRLPAHLHAGHWTAVTLALLIAALVALLVVPVSIVVTLLVVGLVLALALSPLWLLMALAVWLWRRSARRAAPPGATIPGRTSPS